MSELDDLYDQTLNVTKWEAASVFFIRQTLALLANKDRAKFHFLHNLGTDSHVLASALASASGRNVTREDLIAWMEYRAGRAAYRASIDRVLSMGQEHQVVPPVNSWSEAMRILYPDNYLFNNGPLPVPSPFEGHNQMGVPVDDDGFLPPFKFVVGVQGDDTPVVSMTGQLQGCPAAVCGNHQNTRCLHGDGCPRCCECEGEC